MGVREQPVPNGGGGCLVHVASIIPGNAAAVSVHTILPFIVFTMVSCPPSSPKLWYKPLSARNGGEKLRTLVGPAQLSTGGVGLFASRF